MIAALKLIRMNTSAQHSRHARLESKKPAVSSLITKPRL